MFTPEILTLSRQTIAALLEKKMHIVTAESCTAGLIAGALTSIPGSSDVVYGGYVTYANEAKQEMVNVSTETLASFGAVSEQTARAMAEGALARSGADIAIAVTGIAGPGGGSEEKPVGLVYIGCATRRDVYHRKENFGDIGRDAVREATIIAALTMARDITLYDHP
jgi:nicotinamide-nucleotide amidase